MELKAVLVCRRLGDAKLFASNHGLKGEDWHWLGRGDTFKAWVAQNIQTMAYGPPCVVLDNPRDLDSVIATELTIRKACNGLKVLYSGPLDLIELS